MSTNQSNKAALMSINHAQLANIFSDSKQIIAPLKAFLKQAQQQSYECFKQHLNADELIHHRAELMDEVLSSIWKHFGLQQPDVSLIAVGGYGRGELHPYSDIDVLILCKEEQILNQHSQSLQDFITLLWDLKLEIGHSVRTLDECQAQAESDLTIITNLLESRLICGEKALLEELSSRIKSSNMWPADEFFNAKWNEIKARHDKHKHDGCNLEPDIKNASGSLRDIQTITWVTARLFGEGSLEALNQRGFLTDQEYQRIHKARDFLWTLRYCLHMLSEREEDRLLFDWRKQIAEILKIEDGENQLAVEKLMRSFYRTQLLVREICDLLLLHFNQDFLKNQNRTSYIQINSDFALVNGYLQVSDSNLFAREPHWLLSVFLLMANTEHAKGIHSSTIRALRENRHLIDENYRQNPEYNAIFMQIINNQSYVVRELSRMMRYGILARYIPEFGNMIGWMDHDLLNVYTLEVHTFNMIKLLRRFRLAHDSTKERFGLACQLIDSIDKKEILYLAALLHKTGKTQKGDDINNAVSIAEAFCIQHNIAKEDSQMIAWLIQNQKLLQQELQTLDINNPDDIHHLAVRLSDQNHLNYLYLFTVASIETTNPTLWTSFRAEQINQLYTKIKQALTRGLNNPIDSDAQSKKIQSQALEQLIQLGMKEETVLNLWGNPGRDFFLRAGVDNVVWQTQQIANHKPSTKPLVKIKESSNQKFEGGTEIFVYMPDQPSLFAVMTATLDQLNLNIQDAQILVSEDEGNALDVYTVLDENNQPIVDPKRLEEIQHKLEAALCDVDSYSTIIHRKTARTLKQFDIETQITFTNLTDKKQTCLNIIAADRPGLLAKIGVILNDYQIQIFSAKILTEGERVNDTFCIIDQDGKPLNNLHQCEQLKRALIDGLDEQIKAQSEV